MSEHIATIHWRRTSADFTYDSYSRAHEWRFDAGLVVPASASPAYRGDAECVDPEEAFVAALSSCHMLTFLAIAARKRLVVDCYSDTAVGLLTKNERGKLWVSRVTLHPQITFAGPKRPSVEELAKLHRMAHENCFVALSVKTEVVVADG